MLPHFLFLSCFVLFFSYSGAANVSPEKELNGRIVSGYPASRGEFPYQVALLLTASNNTHLCGGALIAPNWVITAAHCVSGVIDGLAFLGILTLAQVEDRVVAQVSSIIQHPDYSQSGLDHDLALLKLSINVTSSDTIQSIALTESVLNPGVYVRVSGWGKVNNADSQVSEVLNYVGLTAISNVECAQFYGEVIQDGIVCAEGATVQSICDGDNGSPLASGGGNSSVLVGIASFSSSSGCDKGFPSAFTRIANYRQWIKGVAGV